MFHVKHHAAVPASVSRETLARLEAFSALLLTWNRTINLVSRQDEARLWDRHILDSLALLPILPDDFTHAIDLGSGGGLPGMVLAIATGRNFHLVESDHRKAAFLREAARRSNAAATVHAERIEAAALPPAPVVTARALAPLSTLLAWATPHLLPGGVCIFPKGRSVDDELTVAATQWHMAIDKFDSPIDPASTILRIRDIQRVGPKT